MGGIVSCSVYMTRHMGCVDYGRYWNRVLLTELLFYTSAVWKAAAYGDLDALRRFNEEDPGSLSLPDEQGYSTLQWAALNNRVAVISYLIDQGCDVNVSDASGQRPLHWSAVRGAVAALETLLRAGADINAVDSRGYNVCHVAAQYGQTSVLYHLMMKWGADIGMLDVDGRSPLHWAAYKGFGDTCRLLLVMGAHPNLPDKEQCSPLHWAAIRGNSEACTVLLQGGAIDSLDAMDDTGATPSQLAVEKGHRMLGLYLAQYKQKHDFQLFLPGPIGKLIARLHLVPFIWVIILGMLSVLYAAVVHNSHFPNPPDSVTVFFWITFVLAICGLYFLFRTTTSDPGFLPQNTASGMADEARRRTKSSQFSIVSSTMQSMADNSMKLDLERGDIVAAAANSLDSPALWAGNWNQLCVSCKIVRPLRAKHCGVTRRCVQNFDHYCPWVANAIGRGNRRFFLLFLWFALGAIMVAAITVVVRLHDALNNVHTVPAPSGVELIWPVIFLVFDFVLLISVMALAVAQTSQVSRNVTTNELANWHRYRYLQDDDGEFINPFDRGLKSNCREVFRPWEAPAPLHIIDGSPRKCMERDSLLSQKD